MVAIIISIVQSHRLMAGGDTHTHTHTRTHTFEQAVMRFQHTSRHAISLSLLVALTMILIVHVLFDFWLACTDFPSARSQRPTDRQAHTHTHT